MIKHINSYKENMSKRLEKCSMNLYNEQCSGWEVL